MISLSALQLNEETVDIVSKVVRENAIGQSVYIEQFEAAISAYTGVKYCIATASGSMADTILLAACKEMYNCKQVIIPALTFIAQPNAARINGMDVLFVDVQDDMLIDTTVIEEMELDDYPAIVFATDLMGRTLNFEELCSPFPVIEDACEAFGSTNAGHNGIAGTFSFFPSHTIGIGEGGCIVTDNYQLFKFCQSIRNHGRANEWTNEAPYNKFHFTRFGFNGKMSGIHAAIGLSQMSRINEFVARRKSIYATMCKELNEVFYTGISPHGLPLHFDRMDNRDVAMRKLTEAGIECRKLFSCIPQREPYYQMRKRAEESFPVASQIADTSLYVPCHQALTEEEIAHIIYTCKRLQGRIQSKEGQRDI